MDSGWFGASLRFGSWGASAPFAAALRALQGRGAPRAWGEAGASAGRRDRALEAFVARSVGQAELGVATSCATTEPPHHASPTTAYAVSSVYAAIAVL